MQISPTTAKKGPLEGPNLLTARDVEARTGLSAQLLVGLRRALGLAVPDVDEPAFSEIDVEAARIVIEFRGAGLPEDAMLEAARPLGLGLAQCARAGVGLLERVDDLGPRSIGELAELTSALAPLLGLMLTMHLREELRHRANAEAEDERDGATRVIFSGFVDMVGFTRMGEEATASAFGEVVSAFADIVVGVADPPTRLVKTIGDEAMFVSPAAGSLLSAVRRTMAEASMARPRIPALRAGIAGGAALSREGDWFGPSVNLASRLTGKARPGTILANSPVVGATPELGWKPVGVLAVKGLRQGVDVFELVPRRSG